MWNIRRNTGSHVYHDIDGITKKALSIISTVMAEAGYEESDMTLDGTLKSNDQCADEDPIKGIDDSCHAYLQLLPMLNYTVSRIRHLLPSYLEAYLYRFLYCFVVRPMTSGIPEGLDDDELSTFMWMYEYDNRRHHGMVLHHYTLDEARQAIYRYGVHVSPASMIRMIGVLRESMQCNADGSLDELFTYPHTANLFIFNYGDSVFSMHDMQDFIHDIHDFPSEDFPLFSVETMRKIRYSDTYYVNHYDIMSMLVHGGLLEAIDISMKDYRWLASVDFSLRPNDDAGYQLFHAMSQCDNDKMLSDIIRNHDDVGLLAMIYNRILADMVREHGSYIIASSNDTSVREFFAGMKSGNPLDFEIEVLLSKIS